MKLRSVILLLIVLAIAVLAALNWTALSVVAPVSLGLAVVDLPLGIVMLTLTVLLGVFFLAYVLSLQAQVLVDTRRWAKDLQSQRELADRAEASRLTELRLALESRLQDEATVALQGRDALTARIDLLESRLAARLEQSDNTTAAYVGQLEDRLAHRDVHLPPG
ncbi:LapA family protein [Xylophilus sp.]|uniref:LapA family protein n=1 Tax=Xylophilus sp. TaxID=2653893 RepID=UPI0013B97B9A|nr:LapA family protein [Xylophilus sp.]KAF1048763.1 MAG: hypothetical protein GAK38_01207 [Xylophilus sp.]